MVVFAVMASSPGGISSQGLIDDQNLEPQAKQALKDYYNRRYGLDLPAPMQYLRWLNNISPIGFELDEAGQWQDFSFWKGSDLGTSFRYGRSVSELLKERVPITLLLNVITIPLIYIISIAIGVYAATQRGKSFDVASSGIMLALWSIPTMLAGILFIGFFASSQYWQWFPASGLSQREALQMPFMPRWTDTVDVLKLLLCVFLSTAFIILLGQKGHKVVRAGGMAVLGGILGIMMANQISGGLALQVSLVVVIAGIFIAVACSDYHAFRILIMGFVGVAIGIGLASHWQTGTFIRGFLFDRMWHLILPIICLSYGGFAFLAKLTRAAVLENLQADYARTARAKGVDEPTVLWRHVFRNSLLPLITVSASLLPGLLGGSVIVESLFSIDGMGKLAVEAVKGRDRELVLSITLISGLLTLAGYLIADICYAFADPRISYD